MQNRDYFMNEKIVIGIIGCGKMGQYHINVVNQSPFIELSGIYDLDKEKVEELSKKHGINAFQSIDSLIANSDAIIIAAPTKYHFELSMKCLSENKHVLVEKPMATSTDEAKQMVALANEKNLIFQVGHVERFNGAVQEIKNIIKSPRIIEARRLAPFNPRISDAGVVFDLMIHDIDIVLSLVKSKLKKIHAIGKKVKTDFEDSATCILEFESNTIAIITSSRVTEEKIRTLSISDEDAYLILDYATQDITIHRQYASHTTLHGKEGLNYSQESVIERVMIHRDNPLKLEIEHFSNCILGKDSPIRKLEEELETLTIAQNIVEQIHSV